MGLYLYSNHFCLIWKSNGIILNDVIKSEIKDKLKIVDKFITEENVNSHCEYIYTPKKLESHLTNFIVYDLETHNTDRARPYAFCFH